MVTDQQIRRLLKLSKTEKTQEIAASKAGMNVKAARKYLRAGQLPSELKPERHWRMRKEYFSAAPAALLLRAESRLQALSELQPLCSPDARVLLGA